MQDAVPKKTGGGPAGKPLTPLAEAVESVIGASNVCISGIPGAVDTTFYMLNGSNSSMVHTPTAIESDGIVAQDLRVITTDECGDGQQQLNVVAVSPQNSFPSCCCNHSIDKELQMKKLKLEIQNLTLRNKLVQLQIERFEADSQ